VARGRKLTARERAKAAILAGWFFLLITNLWLLKPIRQASLLAHLGPGELPYARFGAVIAVAIVVAIYTRLVDRLTRLQVARGASIVFGVVLIAFWLALRSGGETLGGQRWFVWSVFILVDIYSTVIVAIFWTYTNDVVTREEADKIYGIVGTGGILGGIAGGAMIDGLVRTIGSTDMLLVCAAMMAGSAAIVHLGETRLHPAPRPRQPPAERARHPALQGALIVGRSRYLLLIVGIVITYEFAAAMTDFVVSVVLARSYHEQTELARMFGRIGWIVSGVALVSQLVIVPLLLPHKRIALLVPPVAMGLAAAGLTLVPVVAMAIVMSVSDRGLNYSLQQATKETLYVPLGDAEKYKAKAFIDMLVDRFGKAVTSVSLIAVIAVVGISITASLIIALIAIAVWVTSALALGPEYERTVGRNLLR
jgi:AAA family ATP:ADP antiporter